MNPTSDPLDAAYLGMGAIQALDKDNRKNGKRISRIGYGQVEFIQEMLAVCLPALIQHQLECTDYDGCYVYDIVEPLGMWFVNETARMDRTPTTAMALATARKYAE